MAQSLKEQIVDNIKTTVEGVTVANGYNQTMGEVDRKTTPAPNNKTYWPSADIWIENEEKTSGRNAGHRDNTMTVMISAYTDDTTDTDQALSYLAADIEKALMVDHTRNSLAITTEVTNVDHIFADEETQGSMTGMVEIEVRIWFRHRIADPYST